ncbi:MAG TPA: sigma-70 family RNA polymerase sigma factor [Chthoniobacterales bacterium]
MEAILDHHSHAFHGAKNHVPARTQEEHTPHGSAEFFTNRDISGLDEQRDDRDLIAGLVRQDEEAMATLYTRYGSVLKAVIMNVLHDETEAEDVLQDVLLQVWDRALSYSPEKGRLLGWLSTVARRRAIDRVRQACAYRRATDRFEVAANHPDKDIDQIHPVEYEAQQDDVRELIDRQLDLLPDNQRQAICLAYLEGRSQREIATLTHTPLGTVKTRIELGLKKLAHAIGGAKEKIL